MTHYSNLVRIHHCEEYDLAELHEQSLSRLEQQFGTANLYAKSAIKFKERGYNTELVTQLHIYIYVLTDSSQTIVFHPG